MTNEISNLKEDSPYWPHYATLGDYLREQIEYLLSAIYGKENYSVTRIISFSGVDSISKKKYRDGERLEFKINSESDIEKAFKAFEKMVPIKFTVGVHARYDTFGKIHFFRAAIPFVYYSYGYPHIEPCDIACDIDDKVCIVQWSPFWEDLGRIKVNYEDKNGDDCNYVFTYLEEMRYINGVLI